MVWSLRNKATGGQGGSGTNIAEVDIAVTTGDLIYAMSGSRYDTTAIEDNNSNTWNLIEDLTPGTSDSMIWYAIANSTATITITVTFGTGTAWGERYVAVAAFNPGGDAISFVAESKSTESYSTSKTTPTISATENDVLAIAGHSNWQNITITVREVASVTADDYQLMTSKGNIFWSFFTGGFSSEDAYVETATSSTQVLHLSLFELGGGVSVENNSLFFGTNQ